MNNSRSPGPTRSGECVSSPPFRLRELRAIFGAFGFFFAWARSDPATSLRSTGRSDQSAPRAAVFVFAHSLFGSGHLSSLGDRAKTQTVRRNSTRETEGENRAWHGPSTQSPRTPSRHKRRRIAPFLPWKRQRPKSRSLGGGAASRRSTSLCPAIPCKEAFYREFNKNLALLSFSTLLKMPVFRLFLRQIPY